MLARAFWGFFPVLGRKFWCARPGRRQRVVRNTIFADKVPAIGQDAPSFYVNDDWISQVGARPSPVFPAAFLPMKILFNCSLPFGLAHGGQAIQLHQTMAALTAIGVDCRLDSRRVAVTMTSSRPALAVVAGTDWAPAVTAAT